MAKAPICQIIETGRQRGYVKFHRVARDKPYWGPVIYQMLPNDREKLAVAMPADDWMEGIQVGNQSTSYPLISIFTKKC